MLATNGNIKATATSLGLLTSAPYLQTGGKAPEGFEPPSPTLKVGNFPFVHNAHS